MNVFQPASILLPREVNYEKWCVCACDQYVSDPRYWSRVRKNVQSFRSVMHMILPDAEMNNPRRDDTIRYINETMDWYLNDRIFRQFDNAYVYVERTTPGGNVRAGLLGMVDLEAYDYRDHSLSLIRASEQIVEERLPPRVQIRRDAKLDFSHVQLICDDAKRELIEPFAGIRNQLPILYDFDLMERGGHLTGWLVQGDAAADFERRLSHYAEHFREKYPDIDGSPMLFTVGEGNLSLAVAKRCYEERKAAEPGRDFSLDPCRYALVELENLYSPALHLERVHRVVTGTNAKSLLTRLQHYTAPGGYPVTWCIGPDHGVLYLDRSRGSWSIEILQDFLDDYLGEHPGELHYVTGAQNAEEMALQSHAIGFIFQESDKSELFPELITEGLLPRKTFDLCHANEMRYYLECRRLR